jgi:DNA-binding CsgD family transcriptional regulator
MITDERAAIWLRELSGFERLVIWKVMTGCSYNKDIAKKLHSSEQTVKNAFSHIYIHTGFQNKVELALFVARNRNLEHRLEVMAEFDYLDRIERAEKKEASKPPSSAYVSICQP